MLGRIRLHRATNGMMEPVHTPGSGVSSANREWHGAGDTVRLVPALVPGAGTCYLLKGWKLARCHRSTAVLKGRASGPDHFGDGSRPLAVSR